MRRIVIPTALLILLATGLTYWMSHRSLVVERASIGSPPSRMRMRTTKHANLVGQPVPYFTAMDQRGQSVGSASQRGKVVVVNIWATWCQPCREELPRVEREIWQRFRPDVAVVAIAGGEAVARIDEFSRTTQLTFSLVADPRSEIARRFGGDDAIPRTYVIDRSGTIVYQALGYGEAPFAPLVTAVERAVAQH